LVRLGLERAIAAILPVDLVMPSPAQGTIAAEARAGDERVLRYLAPIDDRATRLSSIAERSLLAALDGSCRTPIAALAEIDAGDRLTLRARIVLPDGTSGHDAVRTGAAGDAAALGRDAGEALRAAASPDFFTLPLPEGTPV
jgi:hydroxymethylbilane synthase